MPFLSAFSSSFFAGRRSSSFAGANNPWAPTDDTSIVAWWDASDLGTITTAGSTVTQIADKTGNSFNLVGVNSPTLTTLNGTNAIDFTGTFSAGSDKALTAANTNFGITDGNIIIVGALNIDGVGNERDSIWSILDNDLNNNDIHLRAGNISQFIAAFESDGLGSGGLALSGGNTRNWAGGPYLGDTIHATICDLSGNDIYGRMNGTQRINIANEYFTAVNMSNSTFLIHVNRAENRELDGQFAELMIFNSNDQSLAIKAEGYLAHKWGMANLLPSGHLYKTSPP